MKERKSISLSSILTLFFLFVYSFIRLRYVLLCGVLGAVTAPPATLLTTTINQILARSTHNTKLQINITQHIIRNYKLTTTINQILGNTYEITKEISAKEKRI
jgi:hypothetical protein